MLLNGETCLLTGATGGIGSALAVELANAGASLIVTGRRDDALAGLCASLRPANEAHTYVAADLTRTEDRAKLVACAAQRDVTMLVNLSGVNALGWFDRQSDEAIENLIRTNVTAPVLLTRALLADLHRRPRATIINIGSAFGAIGHPGYVAYSASKFALRGFSEALRRELHDSSVDVLYISPRATQTDMNDNVAAELNEALGNSVDSARWVAREIMNKLAKRKTSSQLGWPEKLFTRVNQLLPGIVDRAFAKQLHTIREIVVPAATLTRPCATPVENSEESQ